MNDIDDADKSLECSEKQLSDTAKYQTFAANLAHGIFKARLFNDGQDANGQPLGGYSTGYIPKRRRKGRQTQKKDLEMTGRLRDSIQVRKFRGNVVLGIMPGKRSDADFNNQVLAGLLEESENREIFSMSDSEVDKIMDAVIAQVEKDFDECMK